MMEFINEYVDLYIKLLKHTQQDTGGHIDVSFGNVYLDGEELIRYIQGKNPSKNAFLSFFMFGKEYALCDGIEDNVKERVIELMKEEL